MTSEVMAEKHNATTKSLNILNDIIKDIKEIIINLFNGDFIEVLIIGKKKKIKNNLHF